MAAISAGEPWVEASGEAEVKGSEVEAKQRAVADALRHCIEERAGVFVKSTFSAEQAEQGGRFDSKVKESIVQNAEGFVSGYEVLESKIEGGVARVRVRARVYGSKLEAELRRLGEAAKGAKIAVAILETRRTAGGKAEPAAVPICAGYIESALVERGVKVLSGAKLDASADEGSLLDAAKKTGAAIVVVGNLAIDDRGPIADTAGLEALKGQTRVQIQGAIRAIEVESKRVLSTRPISVSAIGLDAERAVQRAFAGKGANVIRQLMDQLAKDLADR